MNSIISWVGGKRLLRKEIIPLIPEHSVYCEVFGGAGWVLFGKSNDKRDWGLSGKQPYTEVYNDINGELVNFWRQVKHHPKSLSEEISRELVSREVFDETKRGSGRTEMERAVMFYYLLSTSYGSQSKNFSINTGYRYLPLRDSSKTEKAAERLKNVIIERKDWRDIIDRYDGDGTIFYLDPPYYEHELLYRRDGADKFLDHQEMSLRLDSIKGRFILSYNDSAEIRALYKRFKIREVEATYSVSGTRTRETELIITNY